ncbi:HtaA domain-containing protein [Phenylobacterium sp. 20VBR1]|uniref:HtaA domain-containing protein n=1 Tax=Phenylobacterium glaciei TaxID=2803784 RepID=A0A941HY19_9CAUL|nr:HtaA domain-containing protein [Phenylobacterium glaciei]MBR7620985.1 HtaA domain-containing protein [Phenylobacterium glaciei]
MAAQTVKTLTWGVKQSFRAYVEGAGGTIEAGAGAQRTADGGFTFDAAPDSSLTVDADGKLTGRGLFLGEVQFAAHGGMLKVALVDPILEITDAGALLTVADHVSRTYRLEAARLDLGVANTEPSGEVVLPAALMMFGCQWLGDHYPAGTPLDPVQLGLAG